MVMLHYHDLHENMSLRKEKKKSGGRGRRTSESLRPAWCTKRVPGQPGLQSETLSKKIKEKKEKKSIYLEPRMLIYACKPST